MIRQTARIDFGGHVFQYNFFLKRLPFHIGTNKNQQFCLEVQSVCELYIVLDSIGPDKMRPILRCYFEMLFFKRIHLKIFKGG